MTIAIDIVVRSLADAVRSKLLFRALDSIQNQAGINARPIVVVNGQRFDNRVIQALENNQGIKLHIQQEASAGLALDAGRLLVTAPYFAFLDDDDVFIGGALQEPLIWLENHSQCDVLITNKYIVKDDKKILEMPNLKDYAIDPALSLMDESWLTAGNGIFRTCSINSALLSVNRDNQEWTHIAFRLCVEGKHLHFMDVPTAIYYDTPGSLSKGLKHQEAALDLLQLIRHEYRADIQVRKRAEHKYRNTLHVLATSYWKHGRYGRAWRYHLASMRPPHTFKYLLFTRKMLWPRYKGKSVLTKLL